MTEKLQYAGEYVVERAVLFTSEGVEVDIKNLIISLDIFEDIRINSMTGNLIINDPVAMISTGPLIGQEYLSLRIKTPSRTKTELFDFTDDLFSITRIADKKDFEGHQVYTLQMVTHEGVTNMRTKIRRTLVGTESDIVENLLVNDLKCKKDLYIEPTDGIRKIIPSNLRPFDICNQLSKTACSKEENSPTYYFFETAKGYHFRSLESMYAQTPKFNFSHNSETGKNTVEGQEDVIAELNEIQAYQANIGGDSSVNLRDGVYASRLITHDIFNKRLDTYTFNYHDSFENQKHINYYDGSTKDNPMYSEINLEENKSSRVSDFPVRTYVSPVSRTTDFLHDSSKQQSTGNFNITPYDPERFLLVGSSRKMQLKRGFQINIETKGNTSLNAGDIVTCTLDINSSPDGDIYADRQDRFFQGRFLVTAIRHTFDFTSKMHKSLLSLSKDSVGNKPLGSNFTETRPLTTGRIIKEFYDSSE
jgi:hypothetical protein